jgi:hypothetical protein
VIVLLTRLSPDATTARRRSAALRTARIVGHLGKPRCHDRQTSRIGREAKVIVHGVVPHAGRLFLIRPIPANVTVPRLTLTSSPQRVHRAIERNSLREGLLKWNR